MAETHSLDSEDLVASAVEVALEVDLLSPKQMTFSDSSLVAVIPSRISSMMILSCILEEECKNSRLSQRERKCNNKREETHLEAWASEVDFSMMMMDLDSEVDSVEEVCSNKCKWAVVWEEEVGVFRLSSPHRFQVEALHNQSRQKHI